MNHPYGALDLPKILSMLCEQAVSDAARTELSNLSPCQNEQRCRSLMAETSAARSVLDAMGSPPLSLMQGLDDALTLSAAGAMLTPEQLTLTALFAASCARMRSYLAKGETINAGIASYRHAIGDFGGLQDEIERCIREDRVNDDASPALRTLRRKLDAAEGRIREKLNAVLQSRKQYLADSYVTLRNGRHVVPVLKKYQSVFGGTVVDASAKGGTVFMEPSSIRAMQDELDLLRLDEDAEVRRVLYTLSAMVAESEDALRRSMKLMTALDVLFAKAKLSAAMHAVPVEITATADTVIVEGRHPLLPQSTCVPLDLALTAPDTGVIITGPNTGGKTVTLKTVGLMTVMAQCGLHLPCAPGTRIALRDAVYCDVGDSQSIAQNLSTFSGHMTGVIHILSQASRDSLVLLDELGSGTDPAEGMGLAVAVLEELRLRGCMFVVTTHYPQVKVYAEQAAHILSARMAFDRESLRPLYRLEMGKSGESCALYIASRLGMPEPLLIRARHAAYGESLPNEAYPALPVPKSRLTRTPAPRDTPDLTAKFTMGDSVELLPDRSIGIVYRPCDEDGNVIVQVKGEKLTVRHNRLILRVPAAELYPQDYDFSIVFDTVANRKAAHSMARKFDPDAIIVHDVGE